MGGTEPTNAVAAIAAFGDTAATGAFITGAAGGDVIATALTPCGGVCVEKGLGPVSRGSSAPHPRQNL